MGGQNHQPCSNYLPESTELSRCLSAARAELEHGNVELEIALLAELAGATGSLANLQDHLTKSRTALHAGLTASAALRDKMVRNEFVDLPTLKRLDLNAIGAELANHGLVNEATWSRISEMMLKRGFDGVLTYLTEGIQKLDEDTQALLDGVSILAGKASVGGFSEVLEQNRAGNIKVQFARLYTRWLAFQAEFLASSLISTEVWYAFSGYGSLLPVASATHRAA